MGIPYKAIKQISITLHGPLYIAVGVGTLVDPEIIETVSERGSAKKVNEDSFEKGNHIYPHDLLLNLLMHNLAFLCV